MADDDLGGASTTPLAAARRGRWIGLDPRGLPRRRLWRRTCAGITKTRRPARGPRRRSTSTSPATTPAATALRSAAVTSARPGSSTRAARARGAGRRAAVLGDMSTVVIITWGWSRRRAAGLRPRRAMAVRRQQRAPATATDHPPDRARTASEHVANADHGRIGIPLDRWTIRGRRWTTHRLGAVRSAKKRRPWWCRQHGGRELEVAAVVVRRDRLADEPAGNRCTATGRGG